MGDAFLGQRFQADCVSESADGCHVVSRDPVNERTIVWSHASGDLLWKSPRNDSESDDDAENGSANNESYFENEITDNEAESIIRNCGRQAPHLWPRCFTPYSGELYVEKQRLYSNLAGQKILLGNLAVHRAWDYCSERNVFAAGLLNGFVAICKLITE